MGTVTETISLPGEAGETTRLWLRSYEDPGFVYRDISNRAPRDCTPEEIPVIDLSAIDSGLTERKALAHTLLRAAEMSGFFYIKNHGVSESSIHDAHEKAKEFFNLPLETKLKVKADPDVSFYGYHARGSRRVNPASTADTKEGFNFHYEPRFDPLHEGRVADVPEEVMDHIPKDSFIWNDVGLPDFQSSLLTYWRNCLALGRRLIQLLALGLELPEDYFDKVTTYPGADCTLNFYPGHGETPIAEREDIGLGAHTDLQILTILWQSNERGLQVLNAKNEWVFAPPIPNTFVVNIGDFLMRLTNDRLKSTVHRVIQHSKYDRYSMPVFFGNVLPLHYLGRLSDKYSAQGFNFNEKCGVVPTCIDENHPAKYEPARCGELIAKRLAAVQADMSY